MQNITIYTDGSCLNNPGPGGWAFVVSKGAKDIVCEHFGYQGHATNNQMELQAVIEALRWILSTIGVQAKAQIMTDSRYVQQGISTWIHGWKRNGWRNSQGEAVKNKEHWEVLDRLNAQLQIDWQWVKAHHIDPLNNRVDVLARQGAETQRKSHD